MKLTELLSMEETSQEDDDMIMDLINKSKKKDLEDKLKNIQEKKKYVINPEKRRHYNKTFQENNKDKINESQICEICKGHYTYYNKYHHNKSVKHINALKQTIKDLENNS